MGVTLSFRSVIAYSSILELGSYIDIQTPTGAGSVDLVHLGRSTGLPLTQNQKRIWLLSKFLSNIPSYIIPVTYKFSGKLDYDIFGKSIKMLFDRHQIVYSVIREEEGEPLCDIVPSDPGISFIDYSGLPENEKWSRVSGFLNEDSLKPFNLVKGPLYRAYLLKTGAEENYFHLSIHHIIFDGWSWGVMVRDLSEIYSSLAEKKEPDLHDNEFQQYDYAEWEKKSAGSKYEEELKKFWKDNLDGCSPVLNFPYDLPRPVLPSGKGGHESFHVSNDLSEKLKALGRKEGTSLFVTMLSAFGLLMQKYSGENDLNIGLPIAFRPHTRLENIFGMFVNTIVVRLKYEKEFSFRKLISMTNDAAMDAIAHQELPFEKVVEIVNPERSITTNPLFQVAFDWQNNLGEPLKIKGLSCERIAGEERTSTFDITFYMWEHQGCINGTIEFNIDVLNPDTISRFRKNFITLIQIIVNDPDAPVGSFSMISDEEKRMIDDFNSTQTNYPKDKTIAELFEEQVKLHPAKKAVAFKDESLTYKQLNEKTNQLARILRDLGVKGNEPVGILTEKSIDMIVGILGILKSGGGYVPIDPESPGQRINSMIRDSGCRILLLQEKYMNLPVAEVKKVSLNSPESYPPDKSDIKGINSSSDLAYIMYTSGTTGVPKGSVILQYSIVRLVRNVNYIDITSDDRILLTGAMVFDATTFEIWGALLNGGTLFVAEKETILNPRALGEELRKNGITILWLTSPLFTQIAETRTDIFSGLRYFLVGGDVLSAPHINKLRKDNPDLKVINGYGPTENTTFSTTYLIERDFDHNIPIGKPISNSTAYIFDKYMNYQPFGIVGELYVGGDGLSKGYLNRDDLNKKSFLDHPFKPGERLYKTGDNVKWLPDGNIEFHGRADDQLKIRGFRVELGEIEAVLTDIEGVIEAVIKPVKTDKGELKLAAFLNVSEKFNRSSREITRLLQGKLPSYMIPSLFKFLDGFPKTLNGKVDKKALVVENMAAEHREADNSTPMTPTEKLILNIWCETLKTDDIDTFDNFFDIGGNSLMAISVFSKIEKTFNIELGLRVFFDSPRIKDIADIVDMAIHKKDIEKFSGMKDNNVVKTIKGEI
jgi:gramicidin S synthase 2/tyrocidine synthetase-3